MASPLDTLPDRPLTVEEVRTLNDASSLGALPYSWYRGERVLTLLLVYDDSSSASDGEGRESDSADTSAGSGNDGIGEVEVLNPGNSGGESDDFRVYAVGFDTAAESWTVIAEIEPDSEFETVARTFRDWTQRTYDEELLGEITVEPAEIDDVTMNFEDSP